MHTRVVLHWHISFPRIELSRHKWPCVLVYYYSLGIFSEFLPAAIVARHKTAVQTHQKRQYQRGERLGTNLGPGHFL